MRLLITTMLLFSCLVFAREGDPIIDVEVIIMEIPPAGEVTSTAGTLAVTIKGLPAGAEIVGLPQGWQAGGRGAIILQGPPAGDKITIKFTSPDPNWQAHVAGFMGGESLWDAGLLTRDSAGITTMIMKADGVVNSPAAKCFKTKQRANSYKSSSSNDKKTKGELATSPGTSTQPPQTAPGLPGEPAKASDVVGNWISEPAPGQLGVSQSSYSFLQDGTYSHKLDFISFCDGCSGRIDCDYFWMIWEGTYTVQSGVFTLKTEGMKRVILPTGQAAPIVTEDPNHPQSYEIMVERQGGNLLIREPAEGEASVFKREKNEL
jgi:hypothetical protein